MNINIHVDYSPEDENYVKASARIRHISKSELFRRVFKQSVKDQLFLAILDDAKEPVD